MLLLKESCIGSLRTEANAFGDEHLPLLHHGDPVLRPQCEKEGQAW